MIIRYCHERGVLAVQTSTSDSITQYIMIIMVECFGYPQVENIYPEVIVVRLLGRSSLSDQPCEVSFTVYMACKTSKRTNPDNTTFFKFP